MDHFEALREADAVGMKAVLLKDHYYPSMPIATLINDNLGLQTRALGSIVLTNPVGGLNPSAVDYALKQGARVRARLETEERTLRGRRAARWALERQGSVATGIGAYNLPVPSRRGEPDRDCGVRLTCFHSFSTFSGWSSAGSGWRWDGFWPLSSWRSRSLACPGRARR
ncbi:DUF6282 family protein [Pararhodobacter sp. SW119]|uniref:DUF6282 family protein n=1 Tax=Pararhodobacter sp. SW119 TaxID=2780075 RepID=UPI0032AEAA2D